MQTPLELQSIVPVSGLVPSASGSDSTSRSLRDRSGLPIPRFVSAASMVFVWLPLAMAFALAFSVEVSLRIPIMIMHTSLGLGPDVQTASSWTTSSSNSMWMHPVNAEHLPAVMHVYTGAPTIVPNPRLYIIGWNYSYPDLDAALIQFGNNIGNSPWARVLSQYYQTDPTTGVNQYIDPSIPFMGFWKYHENTHAAGTSFIYYYFNQPGWPAYDPNGIYIFVGNNINPTGSCGSSTRDGDSSVDPAVTARIGKPAYAISWINIAPCGATDTISGTLSSLGHELAEQAASPWGGWWQEDGEMAFNGIADMCEAALGTAGELAIANAAQTGITYSQQIWSNRDMACMPPPLGQPLPDWLNTTKTNLTHIPFQWPPIATASSTGSSTSSITSSSTGTHAVTGMADVSSTATSPKVGHSSTAQGTSSSSGHLSSMAMSSSGTGVATGVGSSRSGTSATSSTSTNGHTASPSISSSSSSAGHGTTRVISSTGTYTGAAGTSASSTGSGVTSIGSSNLLVQVSGVNYQYVGCARSLSSSGSGSSYHDPSNDELIATNATPQLCSNAAYAANYQAFAILNGGTCYGVRKWNVTNYVPVSTDGTDSSVDDTCNIPCSANAEFNCGGRSAQLLFTLPLIYLGCYSDNAAARALPTALGSTKMTVASCAELAHNSSYSYFGLQNAGQCFVSNSYSAATQYGTSLRCTRACTALNTDICGGPYANSLYQWIPIDNSNANGVPITNFKFAMEEIDDEIETDDNSTQTSTGAKNIQITVASWIMAVGLLAATRVATAYID